MYPQVVGSDGENFSELAVAATSGDSADITSLDFYEYKHRVLVVAESMTSLRLTDEYTFKLPRFGNTIEVFKLAAHESTTSFGMVRSLTYASDEGP